MMSDVVTDSSTCPKANAPRAAAAVRGTAWVRSVPTNWLAPSRIEKEQEHDDERP